jgi:hypothetical protein
MLFNLALQLDNHTQVSKKYVRITSQLISSGEKDEGGRKMD